MKLKKNDIISWLFIITVFCVTRLVPFFFLSPIMNFTVVAILFLTIHKGRFTSRSISLILFLLVIPLAINFGYAILLTDNKPVNSLKFFITLVAVGLAYFVRVDQKALRWFIWLNQFQAFVLIGIFLFIILVVGTKTYLPLRFFFLDRGWGDVYTYNGFMFKIQIRGSALLLVAIILTNETSLIKKKVFTIITLVIGLILAGNFAFLIAGGIYLIYTILRLQGKKSVNFYLATAFSFVMIGIMLLPYISDYVNSTLESKKESSIGARNDQINYLMTDLFETPFSALLGQGLGNTLHVRSSFRDYSTSTYYELQTLYIVNQLGIIFFTFYLIYHLLLTAIKFRALQGKILISYLIYICYAITNPYIFDTNHFIVIIVLNSWVYLIHSNAKDQRDNYFI